MSVISDAVQQSFSRYFQLGASGGGGGLSRRFGGFRFGSKRDVLSSIIKDRLYLSDISIVEKEFSQPSKRDSQALVVSCNHFGEIRDLVARLHNAQSSHFMLAMDDHTGNVDDIEHIVDALVTMKAQYDARQPIYVHCREGVGRSVMLTYGFIAFLYLSGDNEINTAIKALSEKHDCQLDPAADNYLKNLIELSYALVRSKRDCSQFDDSKSAICKEVLELLQQRLEADTSLQKVREPDEAFLADVVQLPSFKFLVCEYMSNDLKEGLMSQIKCGDTTMLNTMRKALNINQSDDAQEPEVAAMKATIKTYTTNHLGQLNEERQQFLLDLVNDILSLHQRHFPTHTPVVTQEESTSQATAMNWQN